MASPSDHAVETAKAIKTRICIISDTHCSFPQLPPADLLVHCGDLTRSGRLRQLQPQYEHIAAAPAELKLVIPGNHDLTLDRPYYARKGDYMHKIRYVDDKADGEAELEDLDACYDLWTSEFARAKGVRYLEEGMSTHELSNGARFTVYASPYQPDFGDKAFAYFRHQDRYNPPPASPSAEDDGGKGTVYVADASPVPDYGEVDLMITHGPPLGILDRNKHQMDVGCKHLLRAVQRARPLLHCFGHIHEGWGSGRMSWPPRNSSGQGQGYDEALGTEKNESKEVEAGFRLELSRVDIDQGELFKVVDLTSDGGNPLRQGEATQMVNASIMGIMHKPEQVPFIVDLDLPVRTESNSRGD